MDDTDAVNIVPSPSRFFDDTGLLTAIEAQTPSQDTGDRLVWTRRVGTYEADLASAYRRVRAGSLPWRSHPHHPIRVDGRTVEVTYDGTLDQQLRALYVGHGWAGISAVRDGLRRAATTHPSEVLHPWDVVQEFASYAIAGLWVRVRANLVTLDRLATDELVVQLNLSANLVNEAWETLGVVAKETDEKGERQRVPGPSPSWDTPTYTNKTFFRLTKPAPLQRIMDSMPEAVALRRQLGEVRQREQRLADVMAFGAQEASKANFPGDASMRVSAAELAADAARVTAELEELLLRLQVVTPLAVLAVPFLQDPVTQIAVEQTIGEVIGQFRGEAERIVKGMRQGVTWVDRALPGWSPDQPVPAAYADARSPEVQLLDVAVGAAAKDPTVLSMLSGRTMDRLVQAGAVPQDSFLFAVWAHYRRQLILRLAVEQARTTAVQAVGGLVVKAATLATMLLVRAPAGTVAAPVSTALNIGLLTFQCYSTVHQVAQLDQQLAQAMTEVDRRLAIELVHVGELLASRPDLGEQISQTIATEIGLIAVAGGWPQFRELMHLRGFYSDLQTLLEQ